MRLIFGRRFLDLGAGAQRLAQAYRELGGHGSAAIDHARQRDTRDAEALGELGHRHATIDAQHGICKDNAGMRRVLHSSHGPSPKID
jgi:hypothetical protein